MDGSQWWATFLTPLVWVAVAGSGCDVGSWHAAVGCNVGFRCPAGLSVYESHWTEFHLLTQRLSYVIISAIILFVVIVRPSCSIIPPLTLFDKGYNYTSLLLIHLCVLKARMVAMTCTHAAMTRSRLVELGFKYDRQVGVGYGEGMVDCTCWLWRLRRRIGEVCTYVVCRRV